MKMIIEVESLDDLISLIGLVRVMQEKKPEAKEVKPPEPSKDIAKQAVNIIKNIKETNDARRWREEFLDCPIEVLTLWPPAENSLKQNGIQTVRDLCNKRISSLKKIKNVGTFTLRQIKQKMELNHVKWGGNV